MLKSDQGKDKVKPKVKPTDDGGVMKLLEQVVSGMKDLSDRMDDMDDKIQNQKGEALKDLVHFLYNTDDKHLPELSVISKRAARVHALGIGLEAVFDDDVRKGKVSLSTKIRNAYLRLQRSVDGKHLGRGIGLATEQLTAQADEEAEKREMGG